MKKTKNSLLYEIIFEADTKAGKLFDIWLIIIIVLSIFIVILESIPSVDQIYGQWLRLAEWGITIIFSIEFFLRIYIVKKPASYIFSFYGIIDFLSIIPTYLTLIFAGTHSLLIIRAVRLLRIFRILKITRYLNESKILLRALKASKVKIGVF